VVLSGSDNVQIMLHVQTACLANLKNPNKTASTIFRDLIKSLIPDKKTWMDGNNQKIREAFPKEVQASYGNHLYLQLYLTTLIYFGSIIKILFKNIETNLHRLCYQRHFVRFAMRPEQRPSRTSKNRPDNQ
jgi:hypothetical protein